VPAKHRVEEHDGVKALRALREPWKAPHLGAWLKRGDVALHDSNGQWQVYKQWEPGRWEHLFTSSSHGKDGLIEAVKWLEVKLGEALPMVRPAAAQGAADTATQEGLL
jgi:hypothetical protein